MEIKKLKMENLRAIEVGETVFFTLPSERAVHSARSLVTYAKRVVELPLESVPTGERLTIAYKRVK